MRGGVVVDVGGIASRNEVQPPASRSSRLGLAKLLLTLACFRELTGFFPRIDRIIPTASRDEAGYLAKLR